MKIPRKPQGNNRIFLKLKNTQGWGASSWSPVSPTHWRGLLAAILLGSLEHLPQNLLCPSKFVTEFSGLSLYGSSQIMPWMFLSNCFPFWLLLLILSLCSVCSSPQSVVYFLRLLVGHCSHQSLGKKCLFPPPSTFLSSPYTQSKAEQILLCRCHGTRGGPLWSFCKLHMHTYMFLSLSVTFVNAVSQAVLYLITVLQLSHQDVGWAELRKKKTYLTEPADLCDSHWYSYCHFFDLCHQQIDHPYGDVCGRVGQAFSCWPSKGISNG